MLLQLLQLDLESSNCLSHSLPTPPLDWPDSQTTFQAMDVLSLLVVCSVQAVLEEDASFVSLEPLYLATESTSHLTLENGPSSHSLLTCCGSFNSNVAATGYSVEEDAFVWNLWIQQQKAFPI
jgi:hypothetical protein